MEWLGLSGGRLWATLLGFAAAVVVLYLLKLRRRRVLVAYAPLWAQLLSERQSSALWSNLRRFWSLLLALAVVALLVLALGDPRRPVGHESRTVVVLIDASASMQARDVEPTRLSAAQVLGRDVIDRLHTFDRALVAQLDGAVTPLSPLTDDRDILRHAVDRVAPTELAADLVAGVRYALDVLDGEPSAEIVVISDGGVAGEQRAAALLGTEGAPNLRYLRVGTSDASNLGITAFSVRRYPLDRSHSEVLLCARNYTKRAVNAELTLTAQGVLLHREALTLAPGAEGQVVLRDVPGADRTLTAELKTDAFEDALSADNLAYARLPERRRTHVLNVSSGNRFLEAALLLDEYLKVTNGRPDAPLPNGSYDVLLFDDHYPKVPPTRPALYLAPSAPDAPLYHPLQVTGTIEQPLIGKVDSEHPVTRFTALRDLNIARALRARANPEDRVLAASERGEPLLVTGRRLGQPFVWLGFDPRESDLPMRVAWPLFVLHSLEYLAGEARDYASSHRTGEAVELRVPSGVPTLSLETPAGSRSELRVADGRATFAASRAGFYRVRGKGYDEIVAVNLDRPEEGELAARAKLVDTPPGRLSSATANPARSLWPLLLTLALALLATEWLTFHRRWTV